jgi:uncharacterized protein YqgQ
MTFLSRRRNQNISENDVLNFGLDSLLKITLESDRSIQEKLSTKYPLLKNTEVSEYESKCKEAKSFGHDLVYMTMVTRLKAHDPMTKTELSELYTAKMRDKFPWINKSNLKSIYNLASYGLNHDGWWEFKQR